MSNEVIARIDTSMPSGRKIVRELQKKKAVEIEYPLPPGITGTEKTHQEVFSNLLDRLSEHYDTDMHKVVKL